MLTEKQIHFTFGLLSTCILALSLGIPTAIGQTDPCKTSENTKESWLKLVTNHQKQFESIAPALPTKPLYRAEAPGWAHGLAQGRSLMDQMIANRGGKDNYLNAYPWQGYENDIVWAGEYIRLDRRGEFNDLYRTLEIRRTQMQEKRGDINQLRMAVEGKMKENELRFNQLIKGGSPIVALLKGLGLEIGALGLEKILEKAAEHTAGRGGKALKGGSKAVGVATVLYHLGELYHVRDEYEGADVILPDLLEMMEICAYLMVLEKRYDHLLEIQADLLEQLGIVYQNHLDTCGDQNSFTEVSVDSLPQAKPELKIDTENIPAGKGRLYLIARDAVNEDFSPFINIHRANQRERSLLSHSKKYQDLPAGSYDVFFEYTPVIERRGVAVEQGRVTTVMAGGYGRLQLETKDALGNDFSPFISIHRAGEKERLTLVHGQKFQDLPPGKYDLFFGYNPDFARRGVVVAQGQLTTVRSGGYGRLRFVTKDALGKDFSPFITIYRAGQEQKLVQTRGNQYYDLPPGRYDIKLDVKDGFWKKGVTVHKGAETTISFQAQ